MESLFSFILTSCEEFDEEPNMAAQPNLKNLMLSNSEYKLHAMFWNLPEECMVEIFCNMALQDLAKASMCCKDWNRIALDVSTRFHPMCKLLKSTPQPFCLLSFQHWKKLVLGQQWPLLIKELKQSTEQVKLAVLPTLKFGVYGVGRTTEEEEAAHVLAPVVNFLCDVHNVHWHDPGEEKVIAVKSLFSLLMAFPKYLITQNILLRDFINKLFELGLHCSLSGYAEETLLKLCLMLGTATNEMTHSRLSDLLRCLMAERPGQRTMMIKSVFSLLVQFPWFVVEQRDITQICFTKLLEFHKHPKMQQFADETMIKLSTAIRNTDKKLQSWKHSYISITGIPIRNGPTDTE